MTMAQSLVGLKVAPFAPAGVGHAASSDPGAPPQP